MKRVKEFLQKHWDGVSPLLLGYSGGPDSKALLYSLIEAGVGSHLHVAHVNHGWREESDREEREIQEEIKQLNLPFYSKKLTLQPTKNKEDQARRERLSYFEALCKSCNCKTLLLGHQADELAETALKRIFEGAHLSNLGGMKEASSFHGFVIWRPLLKIKKQAILQYLEEKKLTYFQDPTNQDPQFLRSRFREDIFPFLSGLFGKGIVENLCYMSERAHELQEYLDVQVLQVQTREGPFGFAIHCHEVKRTVLRHLIQKKIALTRSPLESLIGWAEENQIRQMFFQQRWIAGGKGWITLFPSKQDRVSSHDLKKLWIYLNSTIL